MNDEHALILGEIKGKLDLVIENQKTQGTMIQGIDRRLQRVEKKAAVDGALTGALASIGISLTVEGVKRHLGL